MSILLDGTNGIIVSGNTNSFSGVYVGEGAGALATNTAIGVSSLAANTTGQSNTALGASALAVNTSGGSNTAVGRDALQGSSTSSLHTAIGTSALYSNTSGSSNTSVGANSLYVNTTGSFNVAVGVQTLRFSETASNMVAVGYQSLYNNTTGTNNTAVGYQAGYTNQSGSTSTYLGVSAGYLSTGNYNTFVGSQAGYNTTGSGNTFIGVGPTLNGAGWAVTTGSNNTIIGGYTGNNGGLDIRTLSNYIVLSDGDGNPRGYCKSDGAWIFTSSGTSASHRVYGTGLATGEFALLVDKPTNVNTSAQYFIGFSINTQNTGNGMIVGNGASQAAFATFSDARLKTNIVNIESQLEKVCALRPVEFDYIESAGGGHQTGFIAQEMQSVYPDAVNEDANGMLTVAGWSKTEAYLVKAIQEQQAIITQLQADVAALKA